MSRLRDALGVDRCVIGVAPSVVDSFAKVTCIACGLVASGHCFDSLACAAFAVFVIIDTLIYTAVACVFVIVSIVNNIVCFAVVCFSVSVCYVDIIG